MGEAGTIKWQILEVLVKVFFLYPKQNIFSVAVINRLLVCVFMVTNNSQSKKLPERVYIPSNPHFCSR